MTNEGRYTNGQSSISEYHAKSKSEGIFRCQFLYSTDRSEVANVRAYSFTDFRECWLVPLLSEFSGLVIHESVYDELVADSVKNYADE